LLRRTLDEAQAIGAKSAKRLAKTDAERLSTLLVMMHFESNAPKGP
jgi:hypothetical protein